MGNNVRIEQENFRTARVFIDGNELKGVQFVDYRIGLDEIPVITVQFVPETLNFEEEQKGLILQTTVDSEAIAEKVIEHINKQCKLQGKGVAL